MKNTRLPFVLLLFVLISTLTRLPVAAQDVDIAGVWKGSISIPGLELGIEAEFEWDGKDWKGSLDIPLQKVVDMPITEIEVKGQSVKWKLPEAPGNANFDGAVSENGEEMKGNFNQAGQVFPLLIKRESAAEREAAEKRIAEALSSFRTLADSLREKRHVPALGVAIVYKGEVLLSEGFGFREFDQKTRADEQTLFAIGSSSKAFTALCLGMLADEGKLDWDEPIRTYLPDFQMHDRFATEEMNAEDLLCHRSGLPRHDLMWYGSTFSREELFRRLRYLEPNKSFRSSWQYQNLMFMTAGYLAGKLNGSSWEEMVQARIFQPLGMERSNFSAQGLQASDNAAKGYRWDKKEEKMVDMPYRDISAIGPAGSINSNANEMANWLLLHLGDGKFREKEIVSGTVLDKMHQPHMTMGRPGRQEFSAPSYGLGWMTYQYKGHEVVEHGGNIDGFSAEVWLMPSDGFGMVVLSNSNVTMLPTLLCRYGSDMFLGLKKTDWDERAYGKDAEKEEEGKKKTDKEEAEPVKGTHPSHPLADYVGEYEHPGYGLVKVSLKDKQLHMAFNTFELPLEHWHYDVFKGEVEILEEEFRLTFHGNAAGEIDRLTVPLDMFVPDIEFKKLPPQRLQDPTFLARMAGTYAMEALNIKIELSGDQLVMTPTGQGSYKLHPWRNTEFKPEGLNGYSIEFVEGKDGKFNEAVLHQPNGNFRAQRSEEEKEKKQKN